MAIADLDFCKNTKTLPSLLAASVSDMMTKTLKYVLGLISCELRILYTDLLGFMGTTWGLENVSKWIFLEDRMEPVHMKLTSSCPLVRIEQAFKTISSNFLHLSWPI